MKNWIKENWISLMVGFTTALVFINVINLISDIIIKIALIVNG